MATPKNRVPDCGLYRTPKALPGNEERIPAGCIVYFHNHSESGPLPSVLAPDHNMLNRWHFHGPAIENIRNPSWVEALEKLPSEGFYTLRQALTFDEGRGSWPKGSIVQLGYNKSADPILFVATVRAKLDENVLFFADKGMGLPRERLNILEQCSWYTEPDDGSSDRGLNPGH
jgi:hypothetical protein